MLAFLCVANIFLNVIIDQSSTNEMLIEAMCQDSTHKSDLKSENEIREEQNKTHTDLIIVHFQCEDYVHFAVADSH